MIISSLSQLPQVIGAFLLRMKTQTISAKSINTPLAAFILNLENRFAQKNYKSAFKNMNMQSITSNTKNLFSKKKLPRLIVPLVVIVLLVVVINSFFNSTSGSSETVAGTSTGERYEVKEALATTEINKDFQFPIKDANGKEISKFTYTILNAELKDEIVVKGKRATAVKGRLFLILNIKITNNLDQGVQINSRDYIRLTVNGNGSEKIAPDIHNDPVDAQAISTKTTRLGFAINESDSNFVLQVGEIKGEKESVNLSFNR